MDVIKMIMFPFYITYAVVMFSITAVMKIFGLAKWGHRQGKIIAAATNRELRCPQGCAPQPADGQWACSKCGANRQGWVWDKCPVCKTAFAYIPCDSCGHAIVSPKNR